MKYQTYEIKGLKVPTLKFNKFQVYQKKEVTSREEGPETSMELKLLGGKKNG